MLVGLAQADGQRATVGALAGLGGLPTADEDVETEHLVAEALNVFAQIAQLDNVQALKSATSDAARALGIDGETGRLAPGYAADILITDGNPVEDLTTLARPAAVYCRGASISL